MQRRAISMVLTFLMVLLPLSVAVHSLNTVQSHTSLTSEMDVERTIAPIAQLNVPGFQEGSVYTNTTVSSGGAFTCAIISNGSVMCWGYGYSGNLGSGGTSDLYNPTQTSSLGVGRTAVSIAAGKDHTCAILDNGSVACWGYGYYGQIGDGSTTDTSTPTLTASLGVGRTAVAISAGMDHTCSILDNGSVACWGGGSSGQLGDGAAMDRLSPTQTSSLGTGRTAIAIAAGDMHTCALLDNGSVVCWGAGSTGALGRGTATNYQVSPMLTASLGTGQRAVAISSGEEHTCALLENGSISCWGYGAMGALGNGGTSDKYAPTLTSSFGTGRTAVGLSAGSAHTCAILDNGEVSCWGEGSNGQLGEGTGSDSTTPIATAVFGTNQVAAGLSVGGSHTCAVDASGDVSCWGLGQSGRLGNGRNSIEATPAVINNLGPGQTALDIASGFAHSCAVQADGNVTCWGEGSSGQLGNGATSSWYTESSPVLTSSLGTGRTAVAVSAGNDHTCAILDTGSVSCWGSGGNGRLGNGAGSQQTTPTQTSSLGTGRTAVNISSGGSHTCVILDSGTVSCWGGGGYGQLGNGGTSSQNTPTLTSSLGTGRTAVAVSAGNRHTCVILDNGAVSCWGSNADGQLGNGGTSSSSTPTLTSSLGTGRTAISISAGNRHTCAVLDNGAVSCWGHGGVGQLGNGGTSDRLSPTLTSSLGTGVVATEVTTAASHSCALHSTGSVSCWGFGGYGQIGNSANQQRTTPTLTSSFGSGVGATALAAGYDHTCAMLSNGYVSCWGLGSSGQIGNGNYGNRNLPTPTNSFASGEIAALSERDFDGDGVLNIFESNLCQPGTYEPSTAPSTCVDADAGYFVSYSGQTSQTPCPVGTFQADTGQTSCDEAQPGHFVDLEGQATQSPCIAGTYNPTSRSETVDACIDADPGYYTSLDGQSNQQPCQPGTYQPLEGQIGCDDATPGHFVSLSAQTTQAPCLAGTYQPGYGQASCLDADEGHQVSQPGQPDQQACGLGTYQPLKGQEECFDADRGHFVDETGQTSQTPCDRGTYNTNTGSGNASDCLDASPGYYVEETGQANQRPCDYGTFNPNSGSQNEADCQFADPGHYVNTLGQANQTPCDVGTYNPLSGSTSRFDCLDADEGHYVAQPGSANLTMCELGTYQPLKAQSECLLAEPGSHVPELGQLSQTPCVEGTYQSLEGQSHCDEADEGHYVDTAEATAQVPCAEGSFQPLTGQTSCASADPGHYVNQAAQSEQVACEPGTYNPLTGSIQASDCRVADAGHHVNESGQTEQTTCALGTYQNTTGASSCVEASVGFYVPVEGATQQTACPYKTSTVATGSSSQTFCLLDTDADLLPDEIDTDDDGDGTLDQDDAFPLDDSEDKDSDGDGRGDNMQAVAEAKQMRMIFIIGGVLLTFVVAVLALRSRKAEEEEDWYKEEMDLFESEKDNQPSSPPPTDVPQRVMASFVERWEDLPSGDWLDNGEDGTNWYLDDDGNHWHSTEGGYMIWEES